MYLHFIKKILKLFLVFIAIMIPGLILAGIAAVFLVDTNKLKPQLTQIAEQKLGRKLVIDGDFALQFYPYIAIKLTQAHLKNPENFDLSEHQNHDFAYIHTAKLKIELMPLLKGKVQIEELELEGLKLNLTRMAANQDNWSDLVTNLKKKPEDKTEDQSASEDDINNENGNLAKGKFKVKINSLVIKQAELQYQDKPANKNYQFKNVNFYTEKLAQTTPEKIKGDFVFIADNLSTNMVFQGNMLFKPQENKLELRSFTLQSTLASTKLPGGKFMSHLSGDLNADWKKQTFNLQNLTIKFNNSVAKGSANVDFSSGLAARFILGINTLALDRYLPDTHLTLNHIQTNGTFNNQILNFSNLKANLYNGRFQGNSKITFKAKNQYQINGKFDQVNIRALLSDLKNMTKISGTANATVNLSTSGNNGAELKRYLTGPIFIDLRQGYLEGIDVEYYLNKAQVLSKKLPKETELVDNKKTPFDQLTGNFKLQNGVMSNQDLHGFAKLYDLTGAGIVDLVKETIDYQLKVITLRTDGSKRKVPLAILVSGPLNHPKITPDINAYIQAFVQDQIEKQINKQLEKTLGITPNGNSDGSSNHIDKKALQQELINKGLQKLFGK